jgi:hypothetical protein
VNTWGVIKRMTIVLVTTMYQSHEAWLFPLGIIANHFQTMVQQVGTDVNPSTNMWGSLPIFNYVVNFF